MGSIPLFFHSGLLLPTPQIQRAHPFAAMMKTHGLEQPCQFSVRQSSSLCEIHILQSCSLQFPTEMGVADPFFGCRRVRNLGIIWCKYHLNSSQLISHPGKTPILLGPPFFQPIHCQSVVSDFLRRLSRQLGPWDPENSSSYFSIGQKKTIPEIVASNLAKNHHLKGEILQFHAVSICFRSWVGAQNPHGQVDSPSWWVHPAFWWPHPRFIAFWEKPAHPSQNPKSTSP